MINDMINDMGATEGSKNWKQLNKLDNKYNKCKEIILYETGTRFCKE